MRNKLVKNAIGSIQEQANSKALKLEEVLLEAEIVVMVDQSGSMTGRRQIAAEEALEQLQTTYPGKVILIAFESIARVVYDGILPGPSGGTNMTAGLKEGLNFDDGGMKFYLISDGQPNDEDSVYEMAYQYESPINTIFIGEDEGYGSYGSGKEVMRRIAEITRGASAGKIEPKMLADTIRGMLTQGG